MIPGIVTKRVTSCNGNPLRLARTLRSRGIGPRATVVGLRIPSLRLLVRLNGSRDGSCYWNLIYLGVTTDSSPGRSMVNRCEKAEVMEEGWGKNRYPEQGRISRIICFLSYSDPQKMRHIRCACSNANYSSESGNFQDNMRESGVLVRNVVLAGGGGKSDWSYQSYTVKVPSY